GYEQRSTCDPDMMKLIESQAWAAAQREVTQDANIYPRPDSVLFVSCFGSWLDHQAWYARRNFPENPRESKGLLGGTYIDDIVARDSDKSSGSPLKTEGYVQFALLEILVLDQLQAVAGMPGGKSYYIQDGFPALMIGDRAKEQTLAPVYSEILSTLGNSVSTGSTYNCSMMNTLWTRTKCYDFATESSLYSANPSSYDHDGFYTYKDHETASDYRVEASICSASNAEWVNANAASNSEAGPLGIGDAYALFLDLVSGDVACADPIRTGFVVIRKDKQYYDAVCPNPGCHFTAPSSLAGKGRCSK
ncbi:MAG: hypothetical protein KAJ40_08515, partial [Alphaproteobacteria bacterium]|nr:hypothetical protein [Alphaproteobacteria bacterium]